LGIRVLFVAIVAILMWSLLTCSRDRGQDVSLLDADLDSQVLAVLKDAGSDLSKPHPIDFYLYFPAKTDADDVGLRLQEEGFDVTVRLGADDASWLVLAQTTMVPEQRHLQELRRKFVTLADSLGGEYDGWEAMVVE